MNLIEQLGGYECAKAEYDDPMYEDGELYTIKATGARFFKHNLADELLQYRRQHNIFEVGDDVIGLSADEFGDDVIRITRLFEFLGVSCFEYEAVDHTGDDEISLVRHATDEEIKAGRRL